MVKLNMFPFFMIFLLTCTSSVIFTGFALRTWDASNSNTLDVCSRRKVTQQCADAVGNSIFGDVAPLSADCCHELVSLGKPCHDLHLVRNLGSKSTVEKARALAKSNKVWNRCAAMGSSPASSTSLDESISKILDVCSNDVMTFTCAEAIGKSIFEGVALVSDECCRELVYAGQPCHDLHFNRSVATRPNVDKAQALAKSNKVWNRCAAIAISSGLEN